MLDALDRRIAQRYVTDKVGELRDVLLSAGELGTWLSVDEIAELTKISRRSIQTLLYKIEGRNPGVKLVARPKLPRTKPKSNSCEYQVQRKWVL